MTYDLVIAGGGAAGLAAAASFIKETGHGSVCILEKNSILGRKINATGGGRCNLTNKACPEKDMTLDFFRGLGIETWEDSEGRYYPYTNKASDVTKALVDAVMGGSGEHTVDVKCGFTVKVVSRIKPDDGSEGCFMITGMQQADAKAGQSEASATMEMIFANRVLLAMGGKAGPQYGTTGDGYTIARTLGHTVTRVFPILTGIECRAESIDFASLKGVRAKGTVILNKDGKPIVRDTGEIQFTEDGISGICVFNLTPHIKSDKRENFTDANGRSGAGLHRGTADCAEERLRNTDGETCRSIRERRNMERRSRCFRNQALAACNHRHQRLARCPGHLRRRRTG